MILAELRDYLHERGQSSLQDMALHFDSEPDALRGMLEHWIRKGMIQRRGASASCGNSGGSCIQCDPATVEIYVWITGQQDGASNILVRDPQCRK